MINNPEKKVLLREKLVDAVPRRGMSKDFQEGKLPSVVRLYVDGKSVEETAQMLHLSLGDVDSVFHRLYDYFDMRNQLPSSSVLRNAYVEITDRFDGRELSFPGHLCARFGNSYMCYKDFSVFRHGENLWAVSQGNIGYGNMGVYGHGDSSSAVHTDLLALRLERGTQDDRKQIAIGMKDVSGLSNSLIAGLRDGTLFYSVGGLFSEDMARSISRGSIEKYASSIQKKQPLRYRKEIVDKLVDAVGKVLEKN